MFLFDKEIDKGLPDLRSGWFLGHPGSMGFERIRELYSKSERNPRCFSLPLALI
jgi:hypothetical protein